MSQLLELKDIYLTGKKSPRIKNINLVINSGDKVALIGKSGSGKTSLISVANGLIKPTKGEVLWKGTKLNKTSKRAKTEIATLWQDLRLIEELNVCQNINVGALGRHGNMWAIRNLMGLINLNECKNYLGAVGLQNEYIDSNIDELSGGQKQRVALARLLMQKAELVLADEPFSSLDPGLVKNMLSIFLDQKESDLLKIQKPSSALISLHRPELIYLFDRVIVLESGEIVLDERTNDIRMKAIEDIYFK